MHERQIERINERDGSSKPKLPNLEPLNVGLEQVKKGVQIMQREVAVRKFDLKVTRNVL